MRMFLLEDSRPDARMLIEAFKERDPELDIDVVETVDEAVEHIDNVCAGRRRDLPIIAVLDIMVPGGNGIDVLHHIRRQPALRDLMVIMLTTSDADADIRAAKEAGATTYYVKPMDLDGFDILAEEIMAFWLDRQRLQPTD